MLAEIVEGVGADEPTGSGAGEPCTADEAVAVLAQL